MTLHPEVCEKTVFHETVPWCQKDWGPLPQIIRELLEKVQNVPLTEAEVEALHVESQKEEAGFRIGDSVSIISGMFEGYNGTVQEISEDKKQVTVLASTGKRDIPIIVESKDIKLAD